CSLFTVASPIEVGPGAIPISASCSGVSVSVADSVLRTSFSTLVSFIVASQNHSILFSHAWMPVALCCFDAALVSFACFVSLSHAFVSTGQHAERIAFVVGHVQVTIQRFDQLVVAAGLLVLLRQPEKHRRVRRIAREHLLEYVNARCHNQSAGAGSRRRKCLLLTAALLLFSNDQLCDCL